MCFRTDQSDQRPVQEDPSSQDKERIETAHNANCEPAVTEMLVTGDKTGADIDASPVSPHHMSDDENTSMLQQIRNITTK